MATVHIADASSTKVIFAVLHYTTTVNCIHVGINDYSTTSSALTQFIYLCVTDDINHRTKLETIEVSAFRGI